MAKTKSKQTRSKQDNARYEKRSKVLSVVVILLVLVIIGGVIGYGSNWYKDFSFPKFRIQQVQTKPEYDDKQLIANTGECYGLRVAYEAVPVEQSNSYGAIKVTAKTLPDYLPNGVTFTADWKNSASAWATGKAVTDYVELTPNSTEVTITCLEPFGEQVVITATSDYVPTVFGTVELDFLVRPEITVATETSRGFYIMNDDEDNSVGINIGYGVGTLKGDLSFDKSYAEFGLKDDFWQALTVDNPYYSKFLRIKQGGDNEITVNKSNVDNSILSHALYSFTSYDADNLQTNQYESDYTLLICEQYTQLMWQYENSAHGRQPAEVSDMFYYALMYAAKQVDDTHCCFTINFKYQYTSEDGTKSKKYDIKYFEIPLRFDANYTLPTITGIDVGSDSTIF